MIIEKNNTFQLHTMNTSYVFRVTPKGHLEHLYYGPRITMMEDSEAADIITMKHACPMGYTIAYDQDDTSYSLEAMCLEASGHGKGDIGESFVEVCREDGSRTTDFVYESFVIDEEKYELKDMPSSYDECGGVPHIQIVLKDKNSELKLKLDYYVFYRVNVIARSSKLKNDTGKNVRLLKLMSNQVDFDNDDFNFTTFNGAWTREMHRNDSHVRPGKIINSSFTGTSSSRANPFTMLWNPEASEDSGDVYGFNLIYSGNHYEVAEVGAFGRTRFVSGINPEGFEALLTPGEEFESPEAVMTYSKDGFNGMSHNMHEFVREHIVRGNWKKKVRPVLLNSWEAAYFDIEESKLLKLAKAGKEVGIELFVMDDGWFGKRDDDSSSLGDWTVNTKKLSGGLKGIAKKINELGLDFGIWVEPEMVNVNSDLYRAHPEWAIDIPGKDHSEGRNQRILDFANPSVVDYVIDSMSYVFESANIAYVKWDMNRNFSDYYSKYLPEERKGETNHRYVQGLYRCMKTLTEKFPDILFEGCSGGGNRFDLGILCYFPQIWGSDDTDALERCAIQQGYSYGYPMSTVTAHVSSCPNHQTLRVTPLQSRFNVASFGVCGYECNLSDMKKAELKEIADQIKVYKEWRQTMQFGTFYRYRNPEDNKLRWIVVSPDKKEAVGLLFQSLVKPNTAYDCFKAKGLEADKVYSFANIKRTYNLKGFGDLVNTAAPFHIKQDSLMHNIVAKFVKMPGEVETYNAYGDLLMNSGVKLKSAFCATGYSEEVRYFQDFGSRLYFYKMLEESES